MPLSVVRRKSTGALTIAGTVAGRRVQSNDPKLAAEEAAALEADLLRTAWHGERRGSRTFAEAALSYLEAAPRSGRIERVPTRSGALRKMERTRRCASRRPAGSRLILLEKLRSATGFFQTSTSWALARFDCVT